MATIRKRGNLYHVQIRRRGQSITRTFDRLATAKSWIPKIEGNIERHLYAEWSRLECNKCAPTGHFIFMLTYL